MLAEVGVVWNEKKIQDTDKTYLWVISNRYTSMYENLVQTGFVIVSNEIVL